MIHRVVLDVELVDAESRGEPIAAHQGCEAGIEPGARLADDRQQLAIPPQILGPPLDLLPRQPHGPIVVDRLERTEAAVADVQRLGRKRRLAQVTLQSDERAHTTSDNFTSEVSSLESDKSRPTIVRGVESCG